MSRPPADGNEKARSGEAGSQVVGQALVQILVIFIALGLLQLAFALHVRNIAVDAASEGARRACLYGATVADGQERTQELLEATFSGARPVRVRGSEREQGALIEVTMRVDTALPVLGPFGLPHTLTVEATSWKER